MALTQQAAVSPKVVPLATQQQIQISQQQAQPTGHASAAGNTAHRIQANTPTTSSGSRSGGQAAVQVLMRYMSPLMVSWSCCRRMIGMTAQHRTTPAVKTSGSSMRRHLNLRPHAQQQQEGQQEEGAQASLSISQ